MLTDVHVHLAALPTARNGVRVSPRMMRSPVLRTVAWMLGLPLDKPELANELYLARLKKELSASKRVGRVVLLAMDGTYRADGKLDEKATDFMIPNDLVLQAADEDKRLLPGVSINPMRRDAIKELERCAARGAVLVKVLPNAQGFDPSQTRFLSFYETMARLKLALLCHVGWEFSLIGKDQTLGDPEHLLAPLEAGVTVIAAHGCSQGLFFGEPHLKTMLSLARRYPNFFVDLSAITVPNRVGMLFKLRDYPELADRLLFGTDFPIPCFAYPCLAVGDFAGYRKARGAESYFDRQAIVFESLGLKFRPTLPSLLDPLPR